MRQDAAGKLWSVIKRDWVERRTFQSERGVADPYSWRGDISLLPGKRRVSEHRCLASLQPGRQVPSKGCWQDCLQLETATEPTQRGALWSPTAPAGPGHRGVRVDTAVASASWPCTAGCVTSSSRCLVFRKYNCCLENVVFQIDQRWTQVSSKGGIPWIIFMQHLQNSSDGPKAFLYLTS